MNLYYQLPREGQESDANFAHKNLRDRAGENVCFAANPTCENLPQAADTQSVAPVSDDEGLVYGTATPPTPNQHLTLNPLTILDDWLSREKDGSKRKRRKASIKGRQKHVTATVRKTKAWKRLATDDRERRTLDYAFRSESLAWTLNLTPKKQEQLRRSKTPAKILADAINRACKRVFGHSVPISLALEVTKTGRLHAHGIVTLERRQGKAFVTALKSAGGEVHGCGAGRQTDLRRLWDATGWAGYIGKDFHGTAEALGTDKIVYQCNATVAGAREEYEASLARQKAHRTTQRRPARAKQESANLTHLPETETRQRPSMSQSVERAMTTASQSKFTYRKYMKNNDKNEYLPLTAIRECAMSSAANLAQLERNIQMQLGHTHSMTHIYLDALTYSRLMDALVAISADAYVSQNADAFKIAMGEIAGIWPESVLPDHRTEEFSVAA